MSHRFRKAVVSPSRVPAFRWGLLALLCASTAWGRSASKVPWEGHPFRAKPSVLLGAMKHLPTPQDADVQVLFEAHDYHFDAKGRRTYEHLLVFRILRPEGIDGWGTLQVAWAPWYQAKPSMEAEVITPDGRVHGLDPTAMGVAPAGQDPSMLRDDRVVRVPLPALSVGALVIERSTVRETAPFFAAGTVARYYFGRSVPVLRERFSVDAPRKIPLRVQAMRTSAKLVRTVRHGRVRYAVELGPEPPNPDVEPFTPPDQLEVPEVAYSTGRSWRHVAAAYARIVDRQIARPAARAKVRALARKILGPGAVSRKSAAHEVLAWIQQNIRYTGVELGQAAIIPRPPDVTLRRRFGDCKDLATLAVALLRAVHVRANVALLDTDWVDVPPKSPGFGLFDHAIVYLPGKAPSWLDATSRTRPAGEVPKGDQGHLALVASKRTSRLIEIPRARSADNHLEVFRDVWIAPQGPARVTEHRIATGSIAGGYRAYAQSSSAAELRKRFTQSFEKIFGAKEVSSFSTKGVSPAREPFEFTLEATGSKLAVVKDGKITVSVSPGVVIAWLPDLLTQTPKKGAPPRKADLLFDEPHAIVEHWRLHPPSGFMPVALPKPRVTKLGPAVLRRTVSTEGDGTLEVTYALDTGPDRYTAAQFAAFRSAYQTWGNERIPKVTFELKGRKEIDSGHLKEGLALLADEVSRHPREVLPRLRYASELLKLGFGEAARAQGRAAVKLDPSSSAAHEKLGWILEHDLIGRRFGEGFDWKGAVAQYRKARALDPKRFEIRKSLANLLTYDAQGVHLAKDAPLNLAIAEYQSVRKDLKRDDLDDRLLFALATAGRFDDILKVEPTLPKKTLRTGIWLAALARVKGAKAAFDSARTTLSDEKNRSNALGVAIVVLMNTHLYRPMLGLAHRMMETGTTGGDTSSDVQALVKLFGPVRRFEEVVPAEGDPRRPIFDALALTFDKRADAGAFAKLAVRRERTDRARVAAYFRGALLGGSADLKDLGEAVSPASARDALASTAKFQLDGDPKTGYRVRVTWPFQKGHIDLFVAPEKKRFRLVGTEAMPEALAAQALVEVRQHHPERARRWLKWARALVGPPAEGNRYSAFAALWDAKGKAADGPTLALIAAAGAAESSSLACEAPPLLERALPHLAPELRAWVDEALGAAYEGTGQWKALGQVSDRELARQPHDARWAFLKAVASRRLDPKDRSGALRAFISHQKPSEPLALVLIHLAYARGDFAEGNRIADGLISSGTSNALVYNSRAWYALVGGQANDESLVYARRASELRPKDAAILNTVAALDAELGQVKAARKALIASLKARSDERLQAPDWYVVGRMAEDAGLNESARRAYQRALDEGPADGDSVALARRRLKALGTPPHAP